MTTPLRQFILKRGNTAVSSTYTGPAGEITYDTGLNAIRIHDGITPGGALMPSNAVYTSVQSNVTILQSNVVSLTANDAAQSTDISSLQSAVTALQALASSANATPPDLPAEGALWYDDVSGRLYVYFDGFWIDSSPETVYTLPTATANVLGGVKIGGNLTIVDGVLSATTNLGNLRINDQTISGTQANADIIMSPNGTGWVSVPKLKIPVGSLIQGSANVAITIANLTLNTLLDYSTSSSDNLVIGDYGLPNGVSGSGTGWAVYEFTTNPAPVLEIGDHIAGVGVPFLSNVLHIGTGPNANVIITDQTITSTPPLNGTTIYTTRDVVNAGLNVTTIESTDISLIPGTGGHIITTSDIIPFANDVYNLGTPSRRFKQVWLGAGTLFVLDETLGTDQAIGARDGNLYIAGGAGLTVGKFTLTGNTIALTNPAEDFYIGSTFATGNLKINRPLQVVDETGDSAFKVDRTGRTALAVPTIPAGDIGAFSIIGSTNNAYQPVVNSGGMIHITGNDGAVSRITNDAFGTGSFPAYISRAGRGTAAAPSAIQSGDILSRLSTVGWGTTTYAPASGAPAPTNIEVYARENFTDTASGTEYRLFTAPVGTTTKTLSATINSSGISFANSATQITATDIGITFRDGTRQTTAWLGDVSLDDVNANVTAANVEIAALQSNAATQQTQINAITANAVTAVTAGFGMSVSRNNGTVGVDALGVTTVAGTANQILVNGGTSGANAAITLTLPQSINTNSTVTFSNLTITGNLTVQGNIITAESSALDSKILYLANTATSASQLDGGGIILGNVNAAFKRSILYNYNNNYWDTDGAGLKTLVLNATEANFTGNIFSNGRAHFGGQYQGVDYPNAEVQIDADVNSYSQLVYQNHNSGTYASTDFVAVNDLGGDATHFIDLGINSSTYNVPELSITGPNDGYLFIDGGNLAIGTATTSKVIKFHTSGATAANLRVTIDDSGLTTVNNVTVGGTLVFGDGTTQITSANTIAQIINANLGTVTDNITTLFSNAAAQATQIDVINANITAVNLQISNTSVAVFANAASQQLEINGLRANITAANVNISALQSNTGVLANNINILFANAAAQQSEVTGLRANITAANAQIATLDANLGTATTNITALFSNAAGQSTEIAALRANITAANSAIVTANNAVVSYVNTLNSAMAANVTAANGAAISYTNIQIQGVVANAATQQTEINELRANITAANAAIVTANSAVVSYVNTLNLAMIANVNAANALVVGSTYGNANVAVYLPFNPTIQAINANVAGANAAIITANTGMKSYVDGLNSAMAANVAGANAAIITANTGMKSYVDSLTNNISSGFTANAGFQESEISALRANINAANAAISSSTYSNVNVAAYLSTTTNVNIGNLRITDQTISGTIYGRDVSIFVNNNGAVAGGANVVFNSNLMPTRNYVYTLGSKDRRWAKSFHGPKSIDIDGIVLETDTDVGGSNIYVGNAATFNAPSITSNSVMVATGNITGGNIVSTSSAFFYGQGTTGYNSLYAGVQNGFTNLPSDIAQFTGNANTYIQVNFQNISNGTAATTDFVATTNDGTDTTYYVNLGIAGNTYANATPNNSLGTSLWPRDSYLYAQGNVAANVGGNLVIGTTTATKTVKIIAGGINSANIVGTFDNTGLSVTGNVTSNYYLGDGSKLTNLPGGIGTSVLAGKLSIDPASVGKTAEATQTFTLTGLTTNHKITVTPATALTYGIFITAAWASATNTLSVQFMNITGGSINLGAIDLNYIAWV